MKLKTASQVYAQLMTSVVHAVTEGGMSVFEASRRYNVPRTTLRDRLKNPSPRPVGAPTKFSKDEEKRLAEFLLECSDRGIPLNRNHCSELISQLGVNLGKHRLLFDVALCV